MSWIAKAALAAALLNCGLFPAHAGETQSPAGQWLTDGSCSLYNADAHPGDTVAWTGGCADGYADGLGTATFTSADGTSQSFTGIFAHGAVSDGHVVSRWGTGWSYDGEAVDGVFNGAGILTTAAADRFEGQWTGGKMNGFGILRRANGDRYAGDWKDDKPNGLGELRHADGSLVTGQFVDGRLAQNQPTPATAQTRLMKAANVTAVSGGDATAPFSAVSGKTLVGVDGSSIALNLIEGGMELQVIPADGNARKTTFTFMTDRMGTVVEDTGAPSAGSSVTGFFRLSKKGVEVRYADGRSTLLSANGDGGVLMTTDGDLGPSCRNWYPAGHTFSDSDKKAALDAYASRLGMAVGASDDGGCPAKASPASLSPAPTAAPSSASKAKSARAEIKATIKLKPSPRMAQAAYRIGDFKGLETVAVKESDVHAIDAMPDSAPVARPPAPPAQIAAAQPGKDEASKCLTVDSDGSHWGFRNSCGFAVQFAYCMAGSSDGLAGCGNGNVATTAITGSVTANGFGALTADTSLKEKDVDHNFRWIACGGGAGEVVAHLDRFEPPAGRCERTRTASN